MIIYELRNLNIESISLNITSLSDKINNNYNNIFRFQYFKGRI